MALILYLGLAAIAVFVYVKYIKRQPEEYELLSSYYGDKCWTKDDKVVDTDVRPFKIEIPDTELEDLDRRLKSARSPTPALNGSKFNYGVNSVFMQDFVEYWKKEYKWKDQEKKLNEFPHFKTKIEGLDIHFIHIKPKTMTSYNQPKPIMLIHGWPGSVFEFYKLIPMLTDPTSHGGNETDLFEVIVPSIPGYGFSQASEVMGLGALNTARIFHKLMLRLGHKKYYLQGGDWGSLISTHMSMIYPSAVKGLHINFNGSGSPKGFMKLMFGSIAPNLFFDKEDVETLFPLKKRMMKILQETGYMHLQMTKPDTVGFALTDSPVGLAAYIVEKFSTWTNRDGLNKDNGGILEHWTYDELLTNIMIYWWSGNVTSSMRYYKESISDAFKTRDIKVRVPTGYAWFPNEFDGVLKDEIEGKYTRLLSFTRMKDGGHFAAFQVPNLLIEDIRNFVRQIERVQAREAHEESEFAQEFKQTHLDRFQK